MALYEISPVNMRGSGTFFLGRAGETLGRVALVYKHANGAWFLADADAAATMPVIGLTMEPVIAGQIVRILSDGFIGRSTWTWTPGGEIYASTTPGELTQVAPAGAGDVVQVVAMATSPLLLKFNSDIGNRGTGGAGDVTIRVNGGADVGTRPRLNLIEGNATYFTVGAVDDAPGTEVDITYTPLGVGARERPAATQGPRNVLNFVEGANITLTVADNVGNQEIDVTIAAAGAAASPQDIFYEAPDPNDFKGTYASMLLIDGQSTLIRQTFYLPTGWDDTWSVDVIVIPDGTGNLRWGITTNFAEVCNDEGYQTHTDSIALGQSAVTADEIECLDITPGLTGALAGDLVGIEFTRDGGNASDTVNDQVHYIGIVLRAPPEV